VVAENGLGRAWEPAARLDVTFHHPEYFRRLFRHPEHWLSNWEYECGKLVHGIALFGRSFEVSSLVSALRGQDPWFKLGMVAVRLGEAKTFDEKFQQWLQRPRRLRRAMVGRFLSAMRERQLLLAEGLAKGQFPDSYSHVFALGHVENRSSFGRRWRRALSTLEDGVSARATVDRLPCGNALTVSGLEALDRDRPR
jgi:hypothetical protein